MSARKLAAGLWRLQLPENVSGVLGRSGQLGFQVSLVSEVIFFAVIKDLKVFGKMGLL